MSIKLGYHTLRFGENMPARKNTGPRSRIRPQYQRILQLEIWSVTISKFCSLLNHCRQSFPYFFLCRRYCSFRVCWIIYSRRVLIFLVATKRKIGSRSWWSSRSRRPRTTDRALGAIVARRSSRGNYFTQIHHLWGKKYTLRLFVRLSIRIFFLSNDAETAFRKAWLLLTLNSISGSFIQQKTGGAFPPNIGVLNIAAKFLISLCIWLIIISHRWFDPLPISGQYKEINYRTCF